MGMSVPSNASMRVRHGGTGKSSQALARAKSDFECNLSFLLKLLLLLLPSRHLHDMSKTEKENPVHSLIAGATAGAIEAYVLKLQTVSAELISTTHNSTF